MINFEILFLHFEKEFSNNKMTWGEFVLILIIAFAVILLCYLNFTNFGYFMENYFIFILLIIFIVLLFVIDFNNTVQITTYIKVRNVFNTPLEYQVPYHNDTDISDIVNITFTGTCEALGATQEDRSVTNTQVNINMKTLAENVDVPVYANNDTTGTILFNIRKIAEHSLRVTNTSASVDTSGKLLDGYLTLSLLCTGNQSINSGFKRLD
jgi:hypothetical protein